MALSTAINFHEGNGSLLLLFGGGGGGVWCVEKDRAIALTKRLLTTRLFK